MIFLDQADENIPNEFGSPNDKSWKRNLRKNFEQIKRVMPHKSDPGVLYENIKKSAKSRTIEDVKFLGNCLINHFVFHNLSDNELQGIVNKMFYAEVNANEFIFKQGDDASSFFIVEKGSLDVIVNDKFVRTLKKGDGFGELALLYNAPRSASIKAKEHCYLWGIDRHTFRNAVEEMSTKHFEENRKFIEVVNLLHTLTKEQKDAVAEVLIPQQFSDGNVIVHEGDPGSSFYIIKEGTVVVSKDEKEIRKLGDGDSFGEQVLNDNPVRGATVKASGNVKCLALSRENLTKILGPQFKTIMHKNQGRWAFERNKLFSKLTKIQIERLLEVAKLVPRKNGDVIYVKGTSGNQKIVVVIEGAIKKGTSDNIAVSKGEAFGDEYIMGPKKGAKVEENLVMKGDGILAEISLQDFTNCIGGSIEEALLKNEKSHEKKMMNLTSGLKQKAADIKLEDLISYKKLGFGQFGSVFLVRQKNIPDFFALKSVSKAQVYEQGLEKYILQEKNVLEALNFPFIMQLVKTFKDNAHIYFLTEFIKGMELFDVIREIGLLGTYDSQFYIGSMILAIEYLHAKSIVYRDLKPENIMIDHTGYLKMIDMGTAKYLTSTKTPGKRTFTIIGTPHYMAPEVLSGKGYGLAVDLWSIGVCLYEFMCGMVPFGEEAEDPYDIYEQIITKPIKFPKYLKDLRAKALMNQLLSKVPEVRLGGSFATLKANIWFEKFDWDKLMDKELKVPYIPTAEKLMSEKDLQKQESLGKKVIKEIEDDEKANPKKFSKTTASVPNWDKDF